MARPRALTRRYGTRKSGGAFAPDKGRVQALLFPRSDWSIIDATLWASLQGFDTKHVDVTDAYVRVHPAGKKSKAKHVKTIPYGISGVRAVVEWR